MTAGRTLVWDLGGVVLRWDPPGLVARTLAHHLTQDDDLPAFTAHVFGGFAPGSEWLRHDRGDISTEELAASIATRTGLPVADVRAMVDAVPGHVTRLPSSTALLDATAAAGVRNVYLSNMPVNLARSLDGDPAFLRLFPAGGVFSCDVRLVKPEPAIYAVAADRLGLAPDPARTMLLDDRAENVEAARAAGWAGLVFTSVEQARADLTTAGWLPGAA